MIVKARPFFERIPAHLGCALTVASLALTSLGSSCARKTEPEQTNVPKPPPETSREVQEASSGSPSAAESASTASAAPPEKLTVPSASAPLDEAAAKTTAAPPRSKRYVVAALGDSITDRRSRGGGYLDVVAAQCPESVFDNYGKGGDMVNQMRARLERDILPRARARGYTHLLVFGGVNDLYSDLTAGRTNDRIERDLSAIYARAAAHGMSVIAITVAPWGGFTRYFDARRGENTRLLNDWIAARAAEGVVEKVVDAYALLSCGDPELLCPEYEPPFRDGLHPGTRGHEALGRALAQTAFADCR